MTPSENDGLPPELDARAEQASFSTARQHVGAAGLTQLHSLEQLIAAGREQIVLTQTLRKLLASTLEQQRALSLAELGPSAPVQQAQLQQIILAAQTQLATAQALRLTIQVVLAQVRETPLEHISSHLLTTLSATVHQQTNHLEEIVQAADGQVSSLEQLARLEQASAQAATRLRQAVHLQSEQELVERERQALQSLEYIRRLEREGHTHVAQKLKLMVEAQVAQQHIAELEQSNAADQREITRLEDERAVTWSQQRELDQAAEQLHQYLQALRQHTVKPEE